MKKETFTKPFNVQTRKLKTSLFFGLLFSILILSAPASAQVCPLACDDFVQVSLDENCSATITPEMILEDKGTDPLCNYTVVVFGTNGLPLPTPKVDGSHIGKTLQVAVYSNGNSCWGHIIVEDKLPPQIVCPPADTVFCNKLQINLISPIVTDNCSGVNRVVLSDNIVMFDCTKNPLDSIIGKRTVVYYYTDASGNRSDTCEQCVYFEKFKESDIFWPRDTIYSCKDFDTIPLSKYSGVPLVNGDPLYPSWGVCKIAVTFEDQLIPVCPKSFKVLRKWTVIDWCAPSGSNIFTHFQIIKVLDDQGPELICQPNVTVSTDVWSCTGSVVLVPPTYKDCSRVTFQVGYKPFILTINGVCTFNGTSTANILKLPNGYFSISGLPLGHTTVVFRGTDECGNITDCCIRVTVEDQVPPTAVCDQKTVVSLTVDGTAKIGAYTFDDGSHDNCAIDYFEVKRMDDGVPCDSTFKNTINSRQWGPYAYFCCDDIGKTLLVAMRVWDVAGNSNTCMVEVVVQDKIAPFIFCPPNITVSCEFDYPDLSVFGTVRANAADRKKINIVDLYYNHDGPKGDAIDGYAYDGCGVTVTETPTYDLKCGRGTITRRFEARDPGGLTSFCIQTITINDFTPNNITIKWPRDTVNNTTCIAKPFLTPELMGKPIINGKDKCSNIFVNSTDQEFTLDPDACLKIIRTWTVIDWCVYQPNNPLTEGYWTWKQIIKVSNTVPPVFSSNCKDITVDVFGPGCQGNIPLIGLAKDDCTDSVDLVWYHEVDLFNDGRKDSSYYGLGANATNVYPIGKHKVTFKVKDACNNETVCTYFLTVRDGKKPTPYCNSSITTTVMPSSKSIEIWAKDFNINSEDNCTPKDSLKYYFNVNGLFVKSLVFDCSNKGKNILRIYVVDEAGNFDYCETTLEIQDPNGVCPTGLTVQGTIVTEDNRGVNNVSVFLERQNPLGSNLTYTDPSGLFKFNSAIAGIDYTVRPEKNTGFLNGVSTQDILMIQRHILGQQRFDTPYKYIAADANNSQTITAADIVEIRKLILGKIAGYTNNQSWRFVPTNVTFPNPVSPFPFTELMNYTHIGNNQMQTNFYGIKIGDVSLNANASNGVNATGTRTNASIEFLIQDAKIAKGEEVIIPVRVSEAINLSGFQWSLEMNQGKLAFQNMREGSLNMTDDHYAMVDNHLRMSYINAEGKFVKADEVLFYLVFVAKEDLQLSQVIGLSTKDLAAELYDSQVEVLDLRLEFRSDKPGDQATTKSISHLFQNKPNPFSNQTVVGFDIPNNQIVQFNIYEMDGKVIKSITKSYNKGYNEMVISRSDIGKTGVFYIQMNTDDFTETKKMVLIR